MKKLAAILFLIVGSSFAQVKINIYTGLNLPIGKEYNAIFLSDHYFPGFNLGVSLNYIFFNKFSLSPFVEYSNYIFKSYSSSSGGIPEIKFVSASGSASKFYKLGFNIKFLPSLNPLPQGYFFTGLSWNIERYGNIKIKWSDMNMGDFESTQKIDNKNYLSQNFGVGIRILKFSFIQLMLEIILSTNYSDRNFGSVNFGVYF